MLFMNTYEIDEAVRRWKDHPVLGPATETLANLRDCADHNSDGWAYWPKPCRAARNLQELIKAASHPLGGGTPTSEEIRKAYVPIKSFLTRHHLTDCCEIVPPGETWITPYPWCIGSPGKQDCAKAGYCRRNPNCGN